jgi:hypothetical protein
MPSVRGEKRIAKGLEPQTFDRYLALDCGHTKMISAKAPVPIKTDCHVCREERRRAYRLRSVLNWITNGD